VAKTHLLLTCKQGNRTIDEFLTELHIIAGLCDLKDMYNRLILQALILGIESDKIRKKLFDLIDFDKAIELCRREEASAIDYKTMTKDNTYGLEQVHLVKHRPPTHQYRSDDTRNTDKHRGQLSHTRSQLNVRRSVGTSRCGNCGGNHTPRSCPAYGKQCNHCKKFNHFAAYRRSRMHHYRDLTETANQVTWNYSSDSDSHHVSTISTTVRDRKLLAMLTAKQAGTIYDIEFQLDTGTSCNTLNTVDYGKLGRPKLTLTDIVLTIYDQSKCAPLGWTRIQKLNKQGCHTTLKFLVVETTQHSLLSWNSCLHLDLLQMPSTKSENVNFATIDPDLQPLLTDFDDIFTGLGKFEQEYRIELRPEAVPAQV